MGTTQPAPVNRPSPSRVLHSPAATVGPCAGHLDVGIIVLETLCWNPEGYYRIARGFPWSASASLAALMPIARLLVAGVGRLRPWRVPPRAGSCLLTTPAIREPWGQAGRSRRRKGLR